MDQIDKRIYNLSDKDRADRMAALIDKLMNSGLDNSKRKTKWKNKEFVERIIKGYLHYLLVDRNKKICESGEDGIITAEDAFSHMEKTYNYRSRPNLKKTKEIMSKLDECFGQQGANKILMKQGKICADSLETLSQKLQIIVEYKCQGLFVDTPQKFRCSPIWLRTRLAYYSEMIALGKEKRKLQDIPASELFADKDIFTKGQGSKISEERKAELIRKYGNTKFRGNAKKTENPGNGENSGNDEPNR